jgi:hypothetical protein
VKPTTRRVLKALRDRGQAGATTAQLGEVAGFRFGARLHELREAGYVIDTRRERRGSSRYTLVAEPGDQVEAAAA